ncbi:MAG: iron-sulfur cluster-binding oxidoreductase [Actinobacteria bacterium]|nr:iron-sulfur cluster-binding oxidoreductase [Actinomycetota bacterium]
MEFSMPIRIRWDVDFKGRSGRAKRIARGIREAAPMFVELGIEGEKGLSEVPAIFAELHQGNTRIEATVPLSSREPFRRLLPPEADAISFVPDEDNLVFLPDVMEEFAESGIRTLHLPNINAVRALALKGHVPIPTPDMIREAVGRISSLGISLGGKKLVVHDYFLWGILRDAFPGEVGGRLEFSGCQAASALAYVDWEGNVYPCDSLPIRLGNLHETAFEKIWSAPARSRILDAIRAVPTECGPCDKLNVCRSGCRGLAYLAAGTLDAPDPCCPEKTTPALK